MTPPTANLSDVKEAVSTAMESAMGALASKLADAVSGAVEKALKNTMQPPTQPPAQFAQPFEHLPPSPALCNLSPAPSSLLHSPTPDFPDIFSPPYQSIPGPSYAPGLPGPPGPSSWAAATPPSGPPLYPPPSPTHQHLRSLNDVLEQVSEWIVPGSVGRVAIKLAKECVFGSDVMAQGKLSEKGLHFIKMTLRHRVPQVSDGEFQVNYWKPALRAIQRACDRLKSKGKSRAQ